MWCCVNLEGQSQTNIEWTIHHIDGEEIEPAGDFVDKFVMVDILVSSCILSLSLSLSFFLIVSFSPLRHVFFFFSFFHSFS